MINHMNLTCWDATDRCVASLRPPAQPQPDPDPPYGHPMAGSVDAMPQKPIASPSSGPPGFLPYETAAPPRNPAAGYNGRRTEHQPLQITCPAPDQFAPPATVCRQAGVIPQPYRQHPTFGGHMPPTYQQPPHQQLRQQTCWDPPGQRQQLFSQSFDQPPARQHTCWEPQPYPSFAKGCDSCVMCGFLTKKQCAGCKMVKYCSEACQISHWTEHKTRCKEMKSLYKANSMMPKSTLRGKRASVAPLGGRSEMYKPSNKILFPYEQHTYRPPLPTVHPPPLTQLPSELAEETAIREPLELAEETAMREPLEPVIEPVSTELPMELPTEFDLDSDLVVLVAENIPLVENVVEPVVVPVVEVVPSCVIFSSALLCSSFRRKSYAKSFLKRSYTKKRWWIQLMANSPLCFSDFHLEGKVDFNRGGVDTDIYSTSSNFLHESRIS